MKAAHRSNENAAATGEFAGIDRRSRPKFAALPTK